MHKMNIKIRKAKKSDSKSFIDLILGLAEFEKLPPPDKKAQKRLIKDTFSDKPLINVLLAFDKSSGDKPVGYAIYFFTYSSFRAQPTLYLEDIYIDPEYRSKGIGQMYLAELQKIATLRKNADVWNG